MSKLHDKRIRLLMVKRYLNAETSIEEERELGEFYATTTEKLTSEEEDVRLLLQATSTNDENFELSKSKVAEFDRMMDSRPCQRTHVPERLRVLYHFLLFANKHSEMLHNYHMFFLLLVLRTL